jgi:molybdopterin/thiamine biosynthesis adenylyltransferase
VAKNIVLAGVGSVTLVDDTPCSLRPPSNFLIGGDVPADTT